MTIRGNTKAAAVAKFARTLEGIHEIPDGSNDGPGVHTIQSSTGAYRAPWCVSTVQFVLRHVLGFTVADDTANAYYFADYAARHGWTIPKPIAGAAVIYHLGAGHAGTVVKVYADGTFDAIEGNEGNAVKLVRRNPRALSCTFVLHPELRASSSKPKPKPKPAELELAVDGPHGGAIVKQAPSSRVAALLPALVKRFGRVTVRRAK